MPGIAGALTEACGRKDMVVKNPYGSDSNVAGCRVLIVEDEYFLADELAKQLTSQGAFVVGPVADFAEAQSHIATSKFDVAILDINLRNELAWPMADELIARRVPFAFATGYGPEVIPERFCEVTRWEKPWELEEVVSGVAQLWRRKQDQDRR